MPDSRRTRQSSSGTAMVLKSISFISLLGGALAGGGLLRAGNGPMAAVVASSVLISAVSLWWMARVLETLLQIRDRRVD